MIIGYYEELYQACVPECTCTLAEGEVCPVADFGLQKCDKYQKVFDRGHVHSDENASLCLTRHGVHEEKAAQAI